MNRFFALWLGILLFNVAPPLFAQTHPSHEFTYDAKGRRDPFVSPETKETRGPKAYDTGDFTVEGIIFDPANESLAVINGKVLREMENLGGFRIDKIERTVVRLSREETKLTLRLNVPTEPNLAQEKELGTDNQDQEPQS
jgi:hypothetical protein